MKIIISNTTIIVTGMKNFGIFLVFQMRPKNFFNYLIGFYLLYI